MIGKIKAPIPHSNSISKKNDIAIPMNIFFSSLFDCLSFLAKNQYLIVCEQDVMYAERVCFDYIQGEIFIPYVDCLYQDIPLDICTKQQQKQLESKYGSCRIPYDVKISKYIVYANGKYQLKNLFVIPPNSTTIYVINIEDLPLYDIENADPNAKSLFDRYLAYCYGYYQEEDISKYHTTKKSCLPNIERKLLREYNLSYYGIYQSYEYANVRQYKLEVLLPDFTPERLQTHTPYHIRRIEFEGELFCRCQEGLFWTNWTKGDMQKLLLGQHYFLKYKEKNVALIFKKTWIPPSTVGKERRKKIYAPKIDIPISC